MRELFIEELADVKGGTNPLVEKVLNSVNWERIRELLYTTHACGEEGPC
jgi:hypothetical protein